MADIGTSDAADKVGGDPRRAGVVIREGGVDSINLAIGASLQVSRAIADGRTLDGRTDLIRYRCRDSGGGNALPAKLVL